MENKKIIIIEDQLILNDILKKILEESFDIVATSDNAKDMLNLCNKYKPDLVLTDICTKNNSSGIKNGKLVKEKYKENIKVLVITGVPEITFIKEAKENNLDGFLYKNIDSNTLITSIKQIINGYKLFPENNLKKDDEINFNKLTEKELEILTLLCSGIDREDIAEQLNITLGTLKNHISSILNKLNFESVSKLLVYCIGNRYVIPKLNN